jgi:sarcosine reductase
VRAEVIRPGEPVRITHVLDAVEPRVRPDGRSAFPDEGKAGEGRTNRLEGVAVLSCLDFPAEERPLHEQESVVDMAGPGAELTPFSQTTNVVLTFRRPGSPRNEEVEAWARRTTLEVAERLARPTLDADPDEVERFELGAADDSLPSVAALVQLSDLGPLYYQYVYGVPAGRAGLPRVIDPVELMDGAVTCGEYHWAALRNPTWFFQNNRLARALYREHGRRLRFAGVVLMRGYEQTAEDKERAAEEAARAARELGADGVVITTDAGGNSHTDVMLTCRACEQAGIRTTVIVAEMADPESTNPGLTDWVPEADSIISVGNAEEPVPAWKPERVLGGEVGLDPVPVRNYLGATNQMGQLALTAATW